MAHTCYANFCTNINMLCLRMIFFCRLSHTFSASHSEPLSEIWAVRGSGSRTLLILPVTINIGYSGNGTIETILIALILILVLLYYYTINMQFTINYSLNSVPEKKCRSREKMPTAVPILCMQRYHHWRRQFYLLLV